MQSVRIIQCLICKVSLLFSALYAKCLYSLVLYMQSVLIILCFICKVSLLSCALYAKYPYHPVRYMQSVLTIMCFICKVSLLSCALYAKRPYYPVLYMQSVLIILEQVPVGTSGPFRLIHDERCATPPRRMNETLPPRPRELRIHAPPRWSQNHDAKLAIISTMFLG